MKHDQYVTHILSILFIFPIKIIRTDNNTISIADCNFNSKDFCAWRPVAPNGDLSTIWHVDDVVFVDAANFVTHDIIFKEVAFKAEQNTNNKDAKNAKNHFAYVQGLYGAETESALESPFLMSSKLRNINKARIENGIELRLVYWKVAPLATLDICTRGKFDTFFNCVDSIAGPGQHQWIYRVVHLPFTDEPFQIILRARGILSAEDIICVDDLQVLLRDDDNADKNSNTEQYNSSIVDIKNDAFISNYRRKEKENLSKIENKPLIAHDFHENDNNNKSLVHLLQRQRAAAIRPQKKTTPLTLFNKQPNAHAFAGKVHNVAVEPMNICRAIKCSFLDDSCFWNLGATWKRTGGSIVRDTAGEDETYSAIFKVPLGAFFEFDLWMSDDSQFLVVEEIINSGHNQNVTLFNHRGMTSSENIGFHRFRVPLRSSYSAVRIHLRSVLPQNAFITLSNTRMVDAYHNELACETLVDMDNEATNRGTHANATPPLNAFANLFAVTPFPILLPTFSTAALNLLTLPSATTNFAITTSTPFPTLVSFPTFPPFTPQTSALAAPTFNPFKPMFERGLTPIVPVKTEQARLTAFQKLDEIFEDGKTREYKADRQFLPQTFDENSNIRKYENDDRENRINNDVEINNNDIASDVNENQSYYSKNKGSSLHIERLHDESQLNTPRLTVSQSKEMSMQQITPELFPESLERVINKLAGGQSHIVGQLKQLARQFGVSSSSRDLKTFETINALYSEGNGTSIPNQKINTLAHLSALLPLFRGENQQLNQQKNEQKKLAIQYGRPPSPFEAPVADAEMLNIQKNSFINPLYTNPLVKIGL